MNPGALGSSDVREPRNNRGMEKRCGKCADVKPLTHFHRWKRGDGYQPWCKACRKAYDAAYSARTLARRRERRAERRREFLVWYAALKETRPCADRQSLPGAGDAVGSPSGHRQGRGRVLPPRAPLQGADTRRDREVRPRVRELPRDPYSEQASNPGRSSAWLERRVWDAEV